MDSEQGSDDEIEDLDMEGEEDLQFMAGAGSFLAGVDKNALSR